MAIKTIDVEITPTGEVLVDLGGFQGVGCDAVAQALVGKNVIRSETKKPEYNVRLQQKISK